MMTNWVNGTTYNIEYISKCLSEYKYTGVVFDQDDTWIYTTCVDAGKKSFRKAQVAGEICK